MSKKKPKKNQNNSNNNNNNNNNKTVWLVKPAFQAIPGREAAPAVPSKCLGRERVNYTQLLSSYIEVSKLGRTRDEKTKAKKHQPPTGGRQTARGGLGEGSQPAAESPGQSIVAGCAARQCRKERSAEPTRFPPPPGGPNCGGSNQLAALHEAQHTQSGPDGPGRWTYSPGSRQYRADCVLLYCCPFQNCSRWPRAKQQQQQQKKDWKRISAESSLMFSWRPNRSGDWNQLNSLIRQTGSEWTFGHLSVIGVLVPYWLTSRQTCKSQIAYVTALWGLTTTELKIRSKRRASREFWPSDAIGRLVLEPSLDLEKNVSQSQK